MKIALLTIVFILFCDSASAQRLIPLKERFWTEKVKGIAKGDDVVVVATDKGLFVAGSVDDFDQKKKSRSAVRKINLPGKFKKAKSFGDPDIKGGTLYFPFKKGRKGYVGIIEIESLNESELAFSAVELPPEVRYLEWVACDDQRDVLYGMNNDHAKRKEVGVFPLIRDIRGARFFQAPAISLAGKISSIDAEKGGEYLSSSREFIVVSADKKKAGWHAVGKKSDQSVLRAQVDINDSFFVRKTVRGVSVHDGEFLILETDRDIDRDETSINSL